MGGLGSGRSGGKRCTDDMHALDVRKISRAGMLLPGRSFNWQWTCNGNVMATIGLRVEFDRVILNYLSPRSHHNSGEREEMKYAVGLEWTACRFGGQRPWWRCPAVGCGRRAAVLFGGQVFACRHCHQLAYRSQRLAWDDRATRRAENLRNRLNWVPGILHGEGLKPKGMHWETFKRLQAQHDAHVKLTLAGFRLRFGMPFGDVF